MRLDINRLGLKNVVDLPSKHCRLYLEKENAKNSRWKFLAVGAVVSVANFYESLKLDVIFH